MLEVLGALCGGKGKGERDNERDECNYWEGKRARETEREERGGEI